MGEQTRLEDITLNLSYTGTDHVNLTGVEFPNETYQTAKLRCTAITVDNRNADVLTGSSDITGVLFSEGATAIFNPSLFLFNSIEDSTINIYSNGAGNKRGVLVSGSNQVSIRDTTISLAAPLGPTGPTPGSYVGVETNDPNATGTIQIYSSTICAPKETAPTGYYTSSDILQTSPTGISNPTFLASSGIQIGAGTELLTKSAGGKSFSSYNYGMSLFYCVLGVSAYTESGYISPGSVQTVSSTYPSTVTPTLGYRVDKPLILVGLSASALVMTSNGVTITVCRNSSNGGALSNPTSFQVYLDTSNLTGSYYNSSEEFSINEIINVHVLIDSGVGVTNLSVKLHFI